jgi:hypothetical protein
VAGASVPPPLVRVVDGALPPRLFAKLARAVRALGTENLRDTYQTTFWFDLGAPAAIAEEVVLALRALLPWRVRGLAGAEWWLSRMRTSDVRVDFHRDRDEALFRRRGVEVHPAVSSVLFLNRCRGGLLVVTAAPPEDGNPARAPDVLDGDLVRPWPNRLAVFAGDLTHGVLDAKGRIPERRLARRTGLRLALVVNWWTRRPESVRRYPRAGLYERLRLDGAAEGGAVRAGRPGS